MFAVIFTANINKLDAEYFETASFLRDLAINQYNCIKFTSCAEGEQEIAISYWPRLKIFKSGNKMLSTFMLKPKERTAGIPPTVFKLVK